MRGGRFDEAITEYKSALDKSKKPLFTVYLNLGATYLQKQDYAAAADAYHKATMDTTERHASALFHR